MVIGNVLKELELKLDRSEAFIILEYVLDMSKAKILMKLDDKLSKEEINLINRICEKRINKEPLQYIINQQFFFGNKFYVNKNVLIPRADTEILVEEILNVTTDYDNVLDLCTGSGCIAISLKKANSKLNITASDVSPNALTVAMLNAQFNNTKVNFLKSNLFENITQKYNVIVSNPPYIKTDDICNLQEEVKYEPNIALDGGVDGLDFYRIIISKAREFLTDDGLIALEIGYNQASDVSKIFIENKYKNVKVLKDYQGNDRVVTAYV